MAVPPKISAFTLQCQVTFTFSFCVRKGIAIVLTQNGSDPAILPDHNYIMQSFSFFALYLVGTFYDVHSSLGPHLKALEVLLS